jgi:hypothetical protein
MGGEQLNKREKSWDPMIVIMASYPLFDIPFNHVLVTGPMSIITQSVKEINFSLPPSKARELQAS